MRRPLAHPTAALGAVLAALALAGCGLGAGPVPTAVQLLVTREFGSRMLVRAGAPKVSAGETVMSLLMRDDTVSTNSDGHTVQSIDGLAGGEAASDGASDEGVSGEGPGGEQAGGRGAGGTVDWFYYVNGVQAPDGAAATSVHPGDHIWWDLHDRSQAESATAVVGSFPEPFVNGIEGKRLPVRIECASVSGYACRTVTASLRGSGVPAAIAAIGSGGAPETLRVIVGPWPRLEGELAAQSIARGPRASGVYARFSANGQALTLLDEQGRPVQTLLAGAGLVAATRPAKEAPVWVVTGTDAAGVDLAAHAFNRGTLEDRFAVALRSGSAIALPVLGG